MKDFYMKFIFWHHNALRNWALSALGKKWYNKLAPPRWAYDLLYADSEAQEAEFHAWCEETCTECGYKNAFCLRYWEEDEFIGGDHCPYCDRGVACPDHNL
jgi:hypothetical protein|tara:strand:- start:866 stop:1168 length:303 start_codon:yes stop_codon:yes gene_type:complete